MSNVDPRPTVEAPDDDPYLGLEDIEGARALQWVAEQNAATLHAATPRHPDSSFGSGVTAISTLYIPPPAPSRSDASIIASMELKSHLYT